MGILPAVQPQTSVRCRHGAKHRKTKTGCIPDPSDTQSGLFEEYTAWGADFTFAGHLHGGFIRLPYFGGVISPQFQLFPKYDHGLYQMDTSSMVVGAGMGNHSGLFRINNPTEIVTVRIKR